MGKLRCTPIISGNEILKNIGAALYVFDMVTSELWWLNNTITDISGYNEEEPGFREIETEKKHYHPTDRSLIKSRLEFFKNRQGECWTGVYRIKHRNGKWIWVFSKVSVINYDYKGNVQSVLGLLIDVNTPPSTEIQLDCLFRERMRIRNRERINHLTAREMEIIPLITNGLSYTEIARLLMIQPNTVNRHRKNILKKLDLANIAALACFAAENGLVVT